jgi:hypothetical protein
MSSSFNPKGGASRAKPLGAFDTERALQNASFENRLSTLIGVRSL